LVDRLDAMTAFSAVAELRGFAAAARRLGLSRPAVTRLVAALEARLGTRLLQRTTRSVALTDAGARYLERARRILSDVAEAEGLARADRTEPAGRFVLSAPSLFGRLHVAPLMCAFLARHPALVGELVLSDRPVSLVEEGVDLAVRIGALADSSLVARRVGRTRRVVVGAPSYLERRGTPRRPEELAGHALVQFTGVSPGPEWRFSRAGREVRLPLAPRFATNSADAAIGHAEQGGGLTMVLAYQVAAAVRAGRLRVILPGFEPPPLPIHLLYPSGRLLSAKVRAFAGQVATTCDWEFMGT
jgi:DNA-binding transcriptional LysR family regulator